MAEDNRENLRQARIIEVDSVIVSPLERAAFIHGVLKQHAPTLTVWDRIAGCAEIIGALSSAEPALEDVAKNLLRRVYVIHYFHGGDLASCLTKSNLPEGQHPDSSTVKKLSGLMGNSDQQS